MATDRKISQLSAIGTPARTNTLTALDQLGVNVRGLVASWLGLVLDTDLTFSDVTTGDVSTAVHGYFPKLPSGVVTNLLGRVAYNPGALTTTNTSSTTGVDVDAVNLAVTFTVPPSGIVRYVQKAGCFQNASNAYWWCVRNTTGSNIANTRGRVTGATFHHAVTAISYETGLTPGATITRRWGHGVSGGTGSIRYGDDGGTDPYGPAVFEVWAA